MFVRPAGPAFSPLDDELALLPGCLTPHMQESLVRLSTWIPSFGKATAELAWFTQVSVSRETARRVTEAAGAVAVALQTAEAAQILQQHPVPPTPPHTLVFSVDGAMIPLVHGQWTEVRTLAVGEVVPAPPGPTSPGIQTTNVSYFSRRTDSATFAEQALVELHRRGVETAHRVGAVVDGAEWCQQFIDLHRPDAVRILDFAHAAEYLTAIGQTSGPHGSLLGVHDLVRLRHDLKARGPHGVLTELRALVAAHPSLPDLPKQLAYLDKRVVQMQYPQFQQDGWPIGSGMVESANKVVVADRLKGAGMHWADAHVNPLLALRNAVCNDRWQEVWTAIVQEQRQHRARERSARRQRRQGIPSAVGDPPALVPPRPDPQRVAVPQDTDRRPPATHPWRKAWSIRQQRKEATPG